MNRSKPFYRQRGHRPALKLSRRWTTLLVVLSLAFLFLRPWFEERTDTGQPDLSGSVEVQPDSESSSPEQQTAPGNVRDVEGDDDPNPSMLEAAVTTETPRDAQGPSRQAEPAPGTLRDLGDEVYVSAGGLTYRSGSADGHRLKHVLRHAEDSPDKDIHGVFTGDRQEILMLIDEAYALARTRGPPQVKTEDQGERVVYTVELNRKIGYVGGIVGNRKRHPDCTRLRLVLEGTDVITAFPVDR